MCRPFQCAFERCPIDMGEEEVTLEGTLGLIKPDAEESEQDICRMIREEGFIVVQKRRMRFTEQLAEAFYRPLRGQREFPRLVRHLASGDSVALCLARKDGINKWKQLMGPER